MRRLFLLVAALGGCGHFSEIPAASGVEDAGDAGEAEAALPDGGPVPRDAEFEASLEIPDSALACGETGKICDDRDPCTQNSCNLETEECSFASYQDSDEDGFQPIGIAIGCAKATDCDDGNADAFPGQTKFFAFASDGAEFDYNCDRVSETRWAEVARCTSTSAGCTASEGWSGGAPPCGATGEWVTACALSGMDCVPSAATARTQECR